jgi:PAS domain S-box-containing protein
VPILLILLLLVASGFVVALPILFIADLFITKNKHRRIAMLVHNILCVIIQLSRNFVSSQEKYRSFAREGCGYLSFSVNEKDLKIVCINNYAEYLLGNADNLSIKNIICETINNSTINDGNVSAFKDFKISINETTMYFYLLSILEENKKKYLCLLTTSKINMVLSDIEVIEQQLNDILNTSYDGIVVTDRNLITTKINTAYQKFSGADPSKLINKHANEFIKQGIVEDLAVIKSHKTKQRVFMIQPYPNNKVALVTTTPLLDENGDVIIFVSNVRDMTTLYKMQEDLKTMSDKFTVINNSTNNRKNKNDHYSRIVYRSDTMVKLMLLIQQISKVDSNVIIYGESGVGKGLFARTIHELSDRHSGPFIKVNCGAIPENLIESELFGYEPGSFTGAQKGGKSGLIQAAHKGILFLDEIGEFPFALQVKILEFLQDGEFTKIGGTKSTKVDVRVIAATNKDLYQMVQQNKFRKDLYYRLNVVPITITPLREHKEDIPLLIEHYSRVTNEKYNMSKFFSNATINSLLNYTWPGNIRELQHLIEALFISIFKNEITIEDTYQFLEPSHIAADSETETSKRDISFKEAMHIYEKKFLKEAIAKYGSVKKASEILKIHPATIWRKI